MKYLTITVMCIAQAMAERSVIIGDSMFWSGLPFLTGQPSPLSQSLEEWSDHPIENHARVGASLEDGWIQSIPSQYDRLNKDPPITTLILDGGGNDVISHRQDCEAFNSQCTDMIDRCVIIAENLFQECHHDNVTNIIWLGPYYVSGVEQAVDYATSRLGERCRASGRCYFVDSRYDPTTGMGLKTPEMLGGDGIHPTQEGYVQLARMIWNVTISNNITL
jgi:hypothetical protein